MGRTTIYQYFKNKDEIFYHTVGKTLLDIQKKVESIVEEDSLTFIEKLKKLVFELASEYEHNYIFVLLAEIWFIIKRGNNEIQKCIKEYTDNLKEAITNLILEGIEAEEIKPLDSESMADTIYSFIESITFQLASNNKKDLKSRIDSVNILIDGLKA